MTPFIATYNKKVDPDTITLASTLKLAKYFVHKNVSLLPVEESVECQLCYNAAVSELMLDDDNLKEIEGSVGDFVI